MRTSRTAVTSTPSFIPKKRCAIYTRKSTDHNLDLAFNSLDAQREACEAYVKSQAGEGWRMSIDSMGVQINKDPLPAAAAASAPVSVQQWQAALPPASMPGTNLLVSA